MSNTGSEIFTRTREDALKEFGFFDEEAVPVCIKSVKQSLPTPTPSWWQFCCCNVPADPRPLLFQRTSKVIPLKPLKPTATIIVTGYIPADAMRFTINLVCKSSGNIALHFDARLVRGYVVRNTKYKGSWDAEETCSPTGESSCLFQRNSYIHVTIFCTIDAFQIAINGDHFCAFTYRMPLEEIVGLEICGCLEDVRMRQSHLTVYPDPNLRESEDRLTLGPARSLVELLDVPASVDIGTEFTTGTRLTISGRLKLLPHSFYVNLQKGKSVYPHPIIAMHLNPRFSYGTTAPYVVMNCWSDGSWGKEERHQGHLTWFPGRSFVLTIRCEFEAYSIWLGEKMIGEFLHRLRPSIIDTLYISGDIVLNEISISSS